MMKVTVCSLLLLVLTNVIQAQEDRHHQRGFEHVVIIFQENRTPDNLFQDPNLIANGATSRAAE